jgi:hypothetical protein
MMKIRLPARDLRALLLGLCVVVPILALRYAAIPFVTTWLRGEAQIRAERQLFAREISAIANQSGNEEARRAASGQVAAGYRRLFEADQPNLGAAEALAFIDSVAHENRVDVQQSSTRGTAPAGARLTGLTVDFSGASDLQGVVGFLRTLENGPMLVHVPAFAIEALSDQQPGQPQVLSLKTVIEVFFVTGTPPPS